jgi:hypothetical protein
MLVLVPTLFHALSALAAPVSPGLVAENCEFGEVYAFSKATCEIPLENTGDTPIRVSDVIPLNALDSSDARNLSVAAHSRAYVSVHINAENASGNTKRTFRIRYGDHDEVRASAYGFALSALDQAAPEVDFGAVNVEQPSVKTLELTSHDVADFHILKIIEKPKWLDVSVSPGGRAVHMRIRPDAPWGLHGDLIKVAINTPRQDQAWILVKADVHGNIVPSANPIDLGLLRNNQHNEFRIRLAGRDDKPVKVGKTRLENLEGEVNVLPCLPDHEACRMLQVTISPKQTLGTIKANLWVDLPEEKQKLQIALRGLLVDEDFQVKTLDPNSLQAPAAGDSQQASSNQSASVDLSKAINSAVQQGSNPPPPGNGPLLKWTVANGQLIHGFQFFRAESEDGPFVLQNAKTLPAQAEGNEAVLYQWRDNSAQTGKTYWYYIGIVNKNGTKQQLSQPQKVVAK